MQYIKLYRTRKLNIYENELYCILCDCCKNNSIWVCQRSRNELIDLFSVKISEGTLRRTIASLERKKMILVTRTGNDKNIYEVLKDPNEFYSELVGI